MPVVLGLDTSNYTTSTAVLDTSTGLVRQEKRLLPVSQGALGLRQNEAVFQHIKQLGDLLETLLLDAGEPVAAVAASSAPRDVEGSYMPCFRVGELAGRSAALAARAAFFTFSHQAGHVAAALYGAGRLELARAPFLAFHFSGGTTECLLVRPDAERVLFIERVARTLDISAGQVVDRVGVLLGLGFPAGPALEQLAAQSAERYSVKPAFKGWDCCLSGVVNQCQDRVGRGESPEDIAAYTLDYITGMVLGMTSRVLAAHPGLPLVYAGGVMANGRIRGAVGQRHTALFAPPEFSADNAAGTAVLGAIKGGWMPC